MRYHILSFNESSSKKDTHSLNDDSIKDHFYDLIDEGFSISIKKSYISVHEDGEEGSYMNRRVYPAVGYNPFYEIRLSSDGNLPDTKLIELVNIFSRCISSVKSEFNVKITQIETNLRHSINGEDIEDSFELSFIDDIEVPEDESENVFLMEFKDYILPSIKQKLHENDIVETSIDEENLKISIKLAINSYKFSKIMEVLQSKNGTSEKRLSFRERAYGRRYDFKITVKNRKQNNYVVELDQIKKL